MKEFCSSPSKRMLRLVRAAFVEKGTSLNAWCRENGVVRRTAEQSLAGEIKSANAKKLISRIVDAAEKVDA